eukprot:7096458-Pyramimonas_sp.AAC.1
MRPTNSVSILPFEDLVRAATKGAAAPTEAFAGYERVEVNVTIQQPGALSPRGGKSAEIKIRS